MNRVMAGRLARWHFAPTESSRRNLLKEGISDSEIIVTGNTVIDALLSVAECETQLPFKLDPGKRLILVTAHRRENFGEPLKEICHAILSLWSVTQCAGIIRCPTEREGCCPSGLG
jgi:UDP-N-acetylglucosamine 2-epimerase (non-hydrolysing)